MSGGARGRETRVRFGARRGLGSWACAVLFGPFFLGLAASMTFFVVSAFLAPASISQIGGPWWIRVLTWLAITAMFLPVAALLAGWGWRFLWFPLSGTWLRGHHLVERGAAPWRKRVDLRTAAIRLSAGKTLLVVTDNTSSTTVQVGIGSRFNPAPTGELVALADALDDLPGRPDIAPLVSFLRGLASGSSPDALPPVPADLVLVGPVGRVGSRAPEAVLRLGFAAFAGSFALVGVLILVSDLHISLHQVSTPGTVTRVSHGRGAHTATVSYTSRDGVSHHEELSAFRVVVGQSVTVDYNAADPTEARVDGDWADYIIALGSMLVGTGMAWGALAGNRRVHQRV